MLGTIRKKRSARALVDAFNRHDASAVVASVTPDCRFIDSAGGCIEGHEAIRNATLQFMQMEPEFEILLESSSVVEDELLMRGTTKATDPLVAKDRLWRARIREGLVCEWQSFCDGEAQRLARMLAPEHAKAY